MIKASCGQGVGERKYVVGMGQLTVFWIQTETVTLGRDGCQGKCNGDLKRQKQTMVIKAIQRGQNKSAVCGVVTDFLNKIETDTGDCQVIKSKSEQKQQNSN